MFEHIAKIKRGVSGEVSYIKEETAELADAHSQKATLWTIIEASDIVIAVGRFTVKQYRVPLLVVVLLAYLRIPYKQLRYLYNSVTNFKRSN